METGEGVSWLKCDLFEYVKRRTVVLGLDLALRLALVLDTNGATFSRRVGGHCGSCVRCKRRLIRTSEQVCSCPGREVLEVPYK